MKKQLLLFLILTLYYCSCSGQSPLPKSLVVDPLDDNCGTRLQSTLVDDDYGRFSSPWLASIFWRQKSVTQPFRYMVAGAIISPTTVISVWGGPYGHGSWRRGDNVKYKIPPARTLIVAAGLETTDIASADNSTQIREVEYILPYGDENPDNTEYHLILLRLKSPFDFTHPFVRPICWPSDKLPHLNSDNFLMDDAGTVLNLYASGFAFSEASSSSSSSSPGASSSTHNNRHHQNQTSKLLFQPINMVTKEDCANSFRYHYKAKSGDHVLCGRSKFDGTDSNIESSSCISHGTSLIIPYKGKYYLGGLVALIPSKRARTCSDHTIYFFTNFLQLTFSPFNQWIRSQISCNHNEFSCPYQDCIPLSKVCDKVTDCTFTLLGNGDEDPVYCDAVNSCQGPRNYSCGLNDHCIDPGHLCDGRIHCRNGMDESVAICGMSNNASMSSSSSPSPQNLSPDLGTKRNLTTSKPQEKGHGVISSVTCKMLQYTEGVHQICLDQDSMPVPCHNSVAGTQMVLSCKPYYESKFRSAVMRMTCGENGRWMPFRPFSCDATCGIIRAETVAEGFIAHGQETTEDYAFPWYGAIFRFNDNLKKYEFICGSSIIESSVLVTAAHCCVSEGRPLRAYQKLRIVLAPISSDYEENLVDNSTTIVGVDGIWIPPTFNFFSLTSDIALMRMNRSIEYNGRIRPLCYLSKNRGASLIPEVGSIGKVAGFGKNESGIVAHKLQWASFTVHSRELCAESLRTHIADNEFCSGFQNGSVCMGDSGGGLAFQYETDTRTFYVLKGIVSKGKLTTDGRCDVSSSAVFTHLDSFSDWLIDVLEHIGVS